MAPDPLKELAEKHVAPGMRPKFLSPDTVRRRGTRGFEPVVDAKGNNVKFGEMVLAQIPEDVARKRQQTHQDRANNLAKQVVEEYREQTPRELRDESPRSRESRRDSDEGLQSVRGNTRVFDDE
jgi:hypothetical protein